MEKKKIHLNFDNVANDEYKQWTQEAVGEFLDLFPDYKDLFEITTDPLEADKDCFNHPLTKDELDNLVHTTIDIHDRGCPHEADLEQKLRGLFAEQSDGSYLYQSLPDHSDPKRNITRGFLLLGEQKLKGSEPDHRFPVEICFCDQPHTGSYGEGGQMSGVTMFLDPFEQQIQGKDPQYKKDFFKMLLKHEIGHVFQGKVKHCNDKDCIMQDGKDCLPAFEANHDITFCDSCKKEIEQHMRMIKDPNQVEVTNDETNTPPASQDYEEEDNPNHPDIVRLIKQTFRDSEIDIRATKEKQEEYPFEYNLYKKGEKKVDGAQPNGKITITNEKNITLQSEDVTHFVAVMNAIQQNGGSELRLNLNGSEEAKKAFAARAVIAGMLTGVEIKDNPYSMEELKDIDPRIEKVMQIQQKINETRTAADALETNTDATKDSQLEGALETQIKDTFSSYQEVSRDLLPPKDQLRLFECGAQAVTRARTRNVAMRVAQQMHGNSGNS